MKRCEFSLVMILPDHLSPFDIDGINAPSFDFEGTLYPIISSSVKELTITRRAAQSILTNSNWDENSSLDGSFTESLLDEIEKEDVLFQGSPDNLFPTFVFLEDDDDDDDDFDDDEDLDEDEDLDDDLDDDDDDDDDDDEDWDFNFDDDTNPF